MNYLLLVLIVFGLFFAWAALKLAHEANERAEKIEREEYQRRNDLGGKK
jgi:hypothetical protein